MFAFKYCFFVLVLAVEFSGSNATGERESSANGNLVQLAKNGGVEQDEQENKCNNDSFCWNGGSCVNNTCECLPGTKGPFCGTVEGCENNEEQTRRCGNPDNVYCIYNVTSQKPYCRCKNVDFIYDPHYKICKECDCSYNSNCTFVNGKKTCTCSKDYGVMMEDNMEKYCVYCDCGIHSDGCKYYGYGKKVCNCHPGFSVSISACSECDCGPHGNCSFELFSKKCSCDVGYTEKDGKCQECNCGENGTCVWDDTTGEKVCNCKQGYGVQNGICVECNCYMGKDLISCTFLDGNRKCFCPDGYEENNSNCIDINECLNQTACPPHTDCTNTLGSYECACKTGFRPSKESMNVTESLKGGEDKDENNEPDPKIVGCEDIDECKEFGVCTHNETTNCINTLGSYKCYCKEGFSILPYEKSAEKGCKKDEIGKSWTTLYAALCVVFGVLILGGMAFVLRRKLRR